MKSAVRSTPATQASSGVLNFVRSMVKVIVTALHRLGVRALNSLHRMYAPMGCHHERGIYSLIVSFTLGLLCWL